MVNGGELDKNISNSLYLVYTSAPVFQIIGKILQYAYIGCLGFVIVCLGFIIGFLSSKTNQKMEFLARYATLYVLVIFLSFCLHVLVQLLVNRSPPSGDYSTIQPFYQISPSLLGPWISSFPNNNMTLSSVVVLLPVLFGKQSAIFKWIMGIISGILVLAIGLTEIGMSNAWFTDVFMSLGIVLLVAWMLYWHILFIKDREFVNFHHKLTDLYNDAYSKLIESKQALESRNLEECKLLLNTAKEIFNKSINALQNLPGDVAGYLHRNEYWKNNVSLLLNELEKASIPSRKWIYIF